MNTLLSQLLIKLAQKEADEKRLQTRVASLEMLVSAVISTMDDHKLIKLKGEIDLRVRRETMPVGERDDVYLLLKNITGMASIHSPE
ncbi:anti-adapter protein IraP [Candidatus Symbiopectobacterium sp. NZEC135]|uniref:anti-adapter protein IraP n=1 Tax=Candidatus Symbiopectobacterium sp. NZEC135 TaxID=2820471 RepID=UPI002225DA6C|nr:anti-adapter protein IraP [Candidatus Symbiopectobacterium sp. NZEC135]MCW2480078.1 anti-adapter protein [Candidatus Symbiopectobacterium sp. NZEC135]